MGEVIPDSRWQIGVEAAYAANEARDQLQDATNHMGQLTTAAQIEGVTIDEAVRDRVLNEIIAANEDCIDYFDVAGRMFGPDARKDRIDVEPVVIPEIDSESIAKLEAQYPGYGERVVTRYNEKYVAVDGYIREGRLPEAYRLPELGALIDRAVAVAPTHEHLKKIALEPNVVFVPKGLTREQWNGLFKGQKLSNGEVMEGNWYGFDEELIDPTMPEADDSLWDVAVISETDRPALTNVSKDGEHGSNAKKALKAMLAMPSVEGQSLTSAELVAEVSPREEVYNGMQLSRLERGKLPVDSETWTISKENVKVDGTLRSVFQSFYPGDRQVDSAWSSLGYADVSDGVRPSASGGDLLLKSQANS
jgi:hypothetical protein